MAADVVKLVDSGLAITTNRIKGAGTEPKYIAWGTGSTPAANGDTELEAESAEARTEGTSTRETTNVSNDTYRVTGKITATGDRAITEAGLLDADSGGNLFLHGTFDVINVKTGDSITFTCDTVYDQPA